jgi:hypothetical protein
MHSQGKTVKDIIESDSKFREQPDRSSGIFMKEILLQFL